MTFVFFCLFSVKKLYGYLKVGSGIQRIELSGRSALIYHCIENLYMPDINYKYHISKRVTICGSLFRDPKHRNSISKIVLNMSWSENASYLLLLPRSSNGLSTLHNKGSSALQVLQAAVEFLAHGCWVWPDLLS